MWFIAPIIAYTSYQLQWLTQSGAICATLVGSVVFHSGLCATLQMLLFFLLGSLFTKLQQEKKEKAMPYQPSPSSSTTKTKSSSMTTSTSSNSLNKPKKGRDGYQVMATGGLPALLCALYTFHYISSTNFHILYSTLMAVNMGDTLASEIGMLSNQIPRLITNWQLHVSPGVDGGITLLGSLAACLGGAIIGVCELSWSSIWLCIMYSLIGSGLDSLFGVYFQSQPTLPSKPTSSIVLLQPRMLTYSKWSSLNALINFASSVATAILAMIAHHFYQSGRYNFYPILNLFFFMLVLRSLPVANKLIDLLHFIVIILWSLRYYSHSGLISLGYIYLFFVYIHSRRTPPIQINKS
jgi:uncharacterized membrane protein